MVLVFTDHGDYCVKSKLNVYFGGFTEGWRRVSGEEGAGLWVLGREGGFGLRRGTGTPVGPEWPRHQRGDVPQVLCQAVSPGEVPEASPVPAALCELLNERREMLRAPSVANQRGAGSAFHLGFYTELQRGLGLLLAHGRVDVGVHPPRVAAWQERVVTILVPAKSETHSGDPRAWGKQEPGGDARVLGPNLPLE